MNCLRIGRRIVSEWSWDTVYWMGSRILFCWTPASAAEMVRQFCLAEAVKFFLSRFSLDQKYQYNVIKGWKVVIKENLLKYGSVNPLIGPLYSINFIENPFLQLTLNMNRGLYLEISVLQLAWSEIKSFSRRRSSVKTICMKIESPLPSLCAKCSLTSSHCVPCLYLPFR